MLHHLGKEKKKPSEEILQLYERQDWESYVSPYRHIKPEEIAIGNKLILLGKFLTSQSHISGIFFPTNSVEATQVFDLTAITLGYKPKTSVVYAFKEIQHSVAGGVVPTELPTLDLHSYEKGGDTLHQVLLYKDSGQHYYHFPNSSKILANLENPDFSGTEFELNSLSEPLPTFLRNEIGETKVKEVDRLEILKKLLVETSKGMEGFRGNWEELVEGCSIR
jgi:hypothetical protein